MARARQLVLEDHALEQDAGSTRLVGRVDGHELYFRTDSPLGLVPGAEPFLCAMLVPAMEQARDIVIPDGLSAPAGFLANLDLLQDIYAVWYPGYRKVGIHVETRPDEPPASSRGRALFFSGGLDACHSLHRFGASIDTLVYVRGIDMRLDQDALYRQCLAANMEIAWNYGKNLLAIESNVRFFIRGLSRTGIGWDVAQCCGLGSVANALGIPVISISSSAAWDDLAPHGSHPLTDPLCSSDRVRIEHIGCGYRRHEKLLEVARDDFLLQRIRVCWQDDGLNCGTCEKCLRFRMALTLAGLRSRNFEPLTDHAELDLAPIENDTHYIDWDDNLRLARDVGNAIAVRELEKRLRRYRGKQLLKQIDDLWLGGTLRTLKRKVLPGRAT
ncbi:hypothetical protein ACOPJQ_10155 [Luteimonas dalianensis]|uniref:hypothetical protein n=1 Tax=Luteimonas dalianensis TaxID=1148196 RepID=UPI003BF441DA